MPCRASPPQGEIDYRSRFRHFSTLQEQDEPAPKLPISPLEGEMTGRTEGGATELGDGCPAASD
ncbi:hypothetical protein FJ940_02040 [Mesorhizobium sp. B2-3-7]|nr:hypothetical protein FJ939_01865 [Mesorhizobium sp. B2-3-8]TPM20706.1 hypothetical protein FJ940_02040 [Mesorhizobium sp. B2-3-7]